jgi:hypothetical protein
LALKNQGVSGNDFLPSPNSIVIFAKFMMSKWGTSRICGTTFSSRLWEESEKQTVQLGIETNGNTSQHQT